MNKFILAGAAALALGLSGATPALADGHHHQGSNPVMEMYMFLGGCSGVGNGIRQDPVQIQCSRGIIEQTGHHGSSDGNSQSVSQTQPATVNTAPYDTIQMQLAGNVVENGDRNSQSITQNQTLTDNSRHTSSNTKQAQVSVNSVSGGDDNTQSSTQSQTLTIGGGDSHHGGGHH